MENLRYTVRNLLDEEISLKNLLIATGSITISVLIWKIIRQKRQGNGD